MTPQTVSGSSDPSGARGHALIAFAVVSALGFAVQVALVDLFVTRLAWPLAVATAAAVEAAVIHNWVWHERWTWRGRATSEGRLRRFIAFHATNGATSIVGTVVFAGILARTTDLPLLWRSALAVALTGGFNFIAADRLVFRAPTPSLPAAPPPRTTVVAALAILAALASASPVGAAGPPHDTLAAWHAVVARTEADIASRRTDAVTARQAVADPGDIEVSELPVSDMPGATLQHWRGSVLVPRVRLDAVLHALEQTPPRQSDVPASRILWRDGHRLGLYLRIVRRTLMTVTYDTEHEVVFRRLTPRAAVCRSVMTSAREVRAAGTPDERVSAPDEDRGFLWRLNVYWWYFETPDGVVVVMESLTLGRETPRLLRAVAAPLVRRIARESVRSALEGVRTRFE